ncbi:hypothetical protein [Butyrivibrio sp. VCD2006]|uniref:hypothetical protein n=1 Tax=Butyrivibrio sp. VCD2006 TaxID=1280664 RepID=UPI0004150393|nr:hypothetical protein [Butyrivibrio sp. VCD2006]
MKRITIMTVCATLSLLMLPLPVNAAYDFYNSPAITKDADDQGNVKYTNKANGKTYTVYADGRTEGDDTYRILSKEALRKETVEIQKYKEISISLPYGQASISNVKVKKGKNVISAKISEAITQKNKYIPYGREADGRTFYRERLTGEKVYVDAQTEMYTDYADYKIRVFGKKLGKAVLEYQVNDSAGNKICTKTIKINVKDNANAVLAASFGGKSLILDYSKNANNKKYIYNNKTKTGGQFTRKKSGKFRVKLAKDFQLKSIYVARYDLDKVEKPLNEKDYQGWDMYSATAPLDLNGDGDCNDVIDGFEEKKESTVRYERIRNGQKIKLTKTTLKGGNDYIRKYDNSKHTLTESGNVSVTEIIVIYQDKRTGNYYWWATDINLLVENA